jgi:hypothetical protein
LTAQIRRDFAASAGMLRSASQCQPMPASASGNTPNLVQSDNRRHPFKPLSGAQQTATLRFDGNCL